MGLSPEGLAEMIGLIETSVISGKIAKDALPDLLAGQGTIGAFFLEPTTLLPHTQYNL